MDKIGLRAKLREVRLSLWPEMVVFKSNQILDRAYELINWDMIHAVHCFIPLSALKEVNTQPLLNIIWNRYPDTLIYTTRRKGPKLHLLQLNRDLSTKPAPLQLEFDVIFVPMLGFDKRLQRIGYGGGYYDRLLTTHSQAFKIGLCFENGRVAKVPTEAHDVPLDVIVTESHVYSAT